MMYSVSDKSTNMNDSKLNTLRDRIRAAVSTDATAVSDRLARRARFHRHPWAHNMLGTSRTASAVASVPGTCTETHKHARNTPATTKTGPPTLKDQICMHTQASKHGSKHARKQASKEVGTRASRQSRGKRARQQARQQASKQTWKQVCTEASKR